MRVKTGLLYLLAVAMLPLLVVACGGAKATPTPILGDPTPAPDAQATITSLAQAVGSQTPTPTPVPPEVRGVVLDFVRGHAAITVDWEQFHADFDKWREGLIACENSSIQVALRQFAGQFIGITEEARGLPRSPNVRELADKLIEAIEREESAIGRLRDNWQPGDPTVFEDVDIERFATLALQNEVQDELSDLQKRTAPSSRSLVAAYSLAFRELNSDWDKFHKSYDLFRSQEAELTSAKTVFRLSQLIDEFRDIVAAVRNLPTSEITGPVSQILAEAAEDEDLALRKLRGTFQKSESAPSEVPPAFSESPDTAPQLPEETSTPEDGEVTFIPRDPTLFDAFDDQIVKTNATRSQARQGLAGVVEKTSEENQAAAEEFARQYDLLLQAWNGFHKEYDTWRRSEGGCDQSQAIATLGSFTIRFGELASRVREFPRATFLRPLGELIVEAAEREEQAIRLLRNTWRPFDADVYRTLDTERNMAGKLRRQVAGGIEDILAQYDISVQDPAQ